MALHEILVRLLHTTSGTLHSLDLLFLSIPFLSLCLYPLHSLFSLRFDDYIIDVMSTLKTLQYRLQRSAWVALASTKISISDHVSTFSPVVL